MDGAGPYVRAGSPLRISINKSVWFPLSHDSVWGHPTARMEVIWAPSVGRIATDIIHSSSSRDRCKGWCT